MARMVPFPMLPTESSAERRLYEGFLKQLDDSSRLYLFADDHQNIGGAGALPVEPSVECPPLPANLRNTRPVHEFVSVIFDAEHGPHADVYVGGSRARNHLIVLATVEIARRLRADPRAVARRDHG